MRFMFSQMPKTARRWADEQKETKGKDSFKKMPKKVKGSKTTSAKKTKTKRTRKKK